jgi:thiazole biosynthesis enzyme
MGLDEITITRAIIDSFFDKFKDCLTLDVAIVGGGPAGLVAGYYLAKNGAKVAMFERKLSIGGGMWGGGMMFNEIVVQEDGKFIFDEFNIRYKEYEKGYYTADSIESVACLLRESVKAGLKVFNCISMEDVVVRGEKVSGLVIQWSPVEMSGLHIDPLTIKSKFVIDATGHDSEVVKVVEKKCSGKLFTDTGKIIGERSLWADIGEKTTVENTKEAYPNLYVTGMAANNVFGSNRMGPVFGGMLLSGKKVAEEILSKLND